ncbi:HNH endonuclease signature motif containing protein [Antrihabitans cavernicola]|uniref:HNH endonuclease signature motif containing protein n=1 Tax=Antrihabitans cavernicola TaxID=2495913 RepID=UPI00165915AC|nr:HNH endonuclease signature motif containing protein [Spelaeibacter cavernicola]
MIVDCGNNALAEIAVRIGCSKTMAENYALLGLDLRLRLPLTRAAFAAGGLDYARVAKISRSLGGFTAATVAAAEPEIVAAARNLSPGPLGSAIEQVLIRIAPDEVAQRRIDATQCRRVRKRRDGDLGVFEAVLSPEECEATWQRITEVADTVCTHDRRNRQYRLVDAFQALIHGENRLQCKCGRADCVAAEKVSQKRRTPLVQVSIDVATLLGLLSNPAYLEGYGPIDPALARELAADGTWQAMLTEALEMARALGLVDDDADPAAQATPTADGAVAASDEGGTGAESAPVQQDSAPVGSLESESSNAESTEQDSAETPDSDPAVPDEPAATKPPRACVSVFHGRGQRRKAGWLPEFGSTPALSDPATAELSPTAVAELVANAIAKDPQLANGEHPDGHGGHSTPPPGAVDYKPDAETVAIVRARDRHCRFPGCRVPAKKCQVDHVIPFRHHAPHAGGWTIPSNLQCLCAFHHQLKTMKLWSAKMLPGGIIIWTTSYQTTHITLPDGGMTASPPDPDLIPKIRNGPDR